MWNKLIRKYLGALQPRLNRLKIILVIAGKIPVETKNQINGRVQFFFSKTYRVIVLPHLGYFSAIYNLLPFIKLFYGITKSTNYLNATFLWYNIDPIQNHSDGWVYHAIELRIQPISQTEIDLNKKKFNHFIETLISSGKDKTYLFATGSSLKDAIHSDFNDGFVVLCNTIAKDKKLWHHLNPDIIVAGDAIYHYSNNAFANAFREDLKKRLSESPTCVFIYPSLFHRFIQREFREFEKQLIMIPMGTHEKIIYDLRQDFSLSKLGNVLNILLLPIGSTLTKTICFWGFNGRAPEDKDFWKNSDDHFYNEEVNDIKKNHPAFFDHHVPKSNQSSYANTHHGDQLDNALSFGESIGYRFEMLHPTHTTALQKRYSPLNNTLRDRKNFT